MNRKRKSNSPRRNVFSSPAEILRPSGNETGELNREPILEVVNQVQDMPESGTPGDEPIPCKRPRFSETETVTNLPETGAGPADQDLEIPEERRVYGCRIASCSICKAPYQLITRALLSSRFDEKLSSHSMTSGRKNCKGFLYYLIPNKARLGLLQRRCSVAGREATPDADNKGAAHSSWLEDSHNESLPLDLDCCYSCWNKTKIFQDLIIVDDTESRSDEERENDQPSIMSVNDSLSDEYSASEIDGENPSASDEEISREYYRNQNSVLQKPDNDTSGIKHSPNTANTEISEHRQFQLGHTFGCCTSNFRKRNIHHVQDDTDNNNNLFTQGAETMHPYYDANNVKSPAPETKKSGNSKAKKLSPKSLYDSRNVSYQTSDSKDSGSQKCKITQNHNLNCGLFSRKTDRNLSAFDGSDFAKPQGPYEKTSKNLQTYEREMLEFVGQILNLNGTSSEDELSAPDFQQLVSDFLEAMKEYFSGVSWRSDDARQHNGERSDDNVRGNTEKGD